MRSIQILTNKYTVRKQELEYLIESEINAPYPSIDKLDELFNEVVTINQKDGYLNKLLIDITNARTNNKPTDEPDK